MFVSAIGAPHTRADRFTIVALPDTQNYVTSAANAQLFTQQTQWIVDQINAGNPDNIVFVTHLGDVVSDGDSAAQIARAETALAVLDGGLPDSVIPWGVLPGNHDYASTGNKTTGTDDYVASFGPARFAGKSWFGGAEPSGNNTYQYFTGGGQVYLHLALEWQPTANLTNGPTRDPSPVEWAQSVILDHPGVPVIISTHEHIDDDPPGRSGAGEALWNELIRTNDQIIMVLNGHFHSVGGSNDGEYHQVSTNNFGKPVLEVLQDYQDYPNGGNGWLRIITFDTDTDLVEFRTYSPVLDQFQTETVAQVGNFASRFDLGLDFDTRFDFADPPEPPTEVFDETVFRQGDGGYAGTDDKEIRSSGGDGFNGDAPSISVDGDDGSPGLQPNHALIKFGGLFGDAPGQIAPGVETFGVRLELTVTNAGSGFGVYRMTTPWDESSTWAGLGGDGVTPSVDTAADIVTSVGADDSSSNVPSGLLALDITGSFEDWRNGAANEGLGLVPFPSGTNGVDFDSSEGTAPPALVVRTLLPGFEARAFRQGVGGYAGTHDTQISEGNPGTSYSAATTLSLDADDPSGSGFANHVLIRFDDVFETGRVPTDREVSRAFLVLQGIEDGDGGTLHRVLVDWEDTATWASTFGGDGVQADNTDAVSIPDASFVGATGRTEIDVTASLNAWRDDPASNFGWVLLPAGSDGWDARSAESAEPARPQLVVVYPDSPDCPADLNGDGATTDTDVEAFVSAFLGGGVLADLDGNGTLNLDDVEAFVESFLAGCP